MTPVTRCGCFHLLDRLLSLWYACSSTLHNRILFAGSKVKSFPWVKAGACLPLCCRGDACTSFRLDVGQRVQVNSLRCSSSSPTSGSNHLCDQHGIEAMVVWPVGALRSRLVQSGALADTLSVPTSQWLSIGEKLWISPTIRGHLQATGRDAKGRKQYRYHPDGEGGRAP